MGYLDKAKRVATTYETETNDIRAAKEANDANKASRTVQMPSEGLRNKSSVSSPTPSEPCSASIQGVAIPSGPDTIPRLPWQLERLLSAANSGQLPQGKQYVQGLGLVFDLGTFTLACAASYLVGDRDAALERLWQVHRSWQGVN